MPLRIILTSTVGGLVGWFYTVSSSKFLIDPSRRWGCRYRPGDQGSSRFARQDMTRNLNHRVLCSAASLYKSHAGCASSLSIDAQNRFVAESQSITAYPKSTP